MTTEMTDRNRAAERSILNSLYVVCIEIFPGIKEKGERKQKTT